MKKKIITFIGVILVLCLCFAVVTGCADEKEEENNDPPVGAELTISKTDITMNVNTTEQLTATTSSSDYVITWSSSDAEVASVSNGLVTANSAGTATITVGCRKKGSVTIVESKTCNVTVVNRYVVLDKSSILLLPDTATTATVTAEVEGSTDPVTWTSSDESVATVLDGVITAGKTGTATITAASGDISSSCRVTVANKASVAVRGTVDLASSVGSPIWSSSDESIATVANGTVTGVGLGTVEITATSGGNKEIFIISVVDNEDMTEYQVKKGKKADAANNPNEWFFLTESSMATVSSTPVYKNGVLAIDITGIGTSGANFVYLRYQPDSTGGIFYNVNFYIYAAADGVIAINGVDTQINAGGNNLTVNYTSKKPTAQDTFQLKFRTATAYIIAAHFEESEPEAQLTLNKTSIELLPGGNETLIATYEEGSTFEWTTSNSAVATVANGVVTAVAEGNATITVTSGDKSAECTVIVTLKSVTLSRTFASLYLQSDTDGTSHKTIDITATVSDGGAVEWSSSNESVATVSNGTVTAVAEGWTNITASSGSASRSCLVFVADTARSYDMTEGKNADVPNNPGTWFWAGNKGSGVRYDNGTITANFAVGHDAISGNKTFMVRYMPYIGNNYNVSYKLRIVCSDNVGENDIITVTPTGAAAAMDLKPSQLATGVTINSSNPITGMYQLKVSGIASDVSAEIVISDIVFTPVA